MVNIRTFDLNLLRVLDAVLTEAHVSSAARRLNLSQPATSSALTRLRKALDDPLLVRAGNRMVPTLLARELKPRVRKILAEIEQSLQRKNGFEPATSMRTFRVLANDYAVFVVLAGLAERLARRAPHITLEILPFEDRFEERLADAEYDLALRDSWSMRRWQLRESLFRENFVGIARRKHPRLSVKPTLDEFLAEGHVLISPAGRTAGVVDHTLARTKRTRRVAVTVPHFLAAPGIIAGTDHVMSIASRVALRFSKMYALRVFAPPVRLPGFDLGLAWNARSEADAGVQWLMDEIRQIVR